MSVSNNFLRLGVLSALVGMSLGVWMGANQDFVLRPVHAHINLLGFLILMPSLALMLLQKPIFAPAMIASEIMLVGSMLLFVIIVFMATMKKEPAAA